MPHLYLSHHKIQWFKNGIEFAFYYERNIYLVSGGNVEKKVKHPKKNRSGKKERKLKKVKSNNVLNQKADEDGTLIFQYELSKPIKKIVKKLTSHLTDLTSRDNDEECKAWGLKV